LAPLYALAGLAVTLPIIFHLIRRRPKERILMSSLMFLDPTPPRLTRQSTLDQWLLLLLRVTAIALLAFAFTRPYWNKPADRDADRIGSQRMLLIDTSASMRRDGLWKSAVQRAEQLIRQSGPTDAISVYQFDSTLRPLVAIDSALQTPAAQRQQQAIAALQSVAPTWLHTDLGLSLLTAADLLQTDWDSSSDSNATASEIVVVTDFQNGAEVERLAEYTWPPSCKVRIERVEPAAKGNARASLLSLDELDSSSRLPGGNDNKSHLPPSTNYAPQSKDAEKLRVRVTNNANSNTESLQLHWLDEQMRPIESSRTPCQVPLGSSLTVRMPMPPTGSLVLQLDGDGSGFDNRFYMSRREPIESRLLCIESASRAPDESLGYFLRQLPLSDAARTVMFQSREPASSEKWPSADNTPLIVASHDLNDSDLNGLATYVNQGGNLLWVWDALAAANAGDARNKLYDYTSGLEKLTAMNNSIVTEARVRQYAMLESVDFKHPLFADLSDSKFNDFSKIRFWRHRRLESQPLDDWRILAKFDDRSPAFICKEQGRGKVWILMAGWQPNESQLALSTKFVPLISGLYRLATPVVNNPSSYRVGMSLEIPEDYRILNPAGTEVKAEAIDGYTGRMIVFSEPGVYRQITPDGAESKLAVNLMESESNTAVGGLERLEKLGVVIADGKPTKRDDTARRQLRAVELESQQGWWRCIIVGVLSVIGLESLLCIRKVG
ncbi:MAG TPA: BatA domain-containing protein, partial [Pirellula sp.]|nr:BatA domain-containing protein [Pirellula sp.]